jgi:hypothetical protein
MQLSPFPCHLVPIFIGLETTNICLRIGWKFKKNSVIQFCVHFTVLWYRHYWSQMQKCKSFGWSSLSLFSGRLSWKIGEPVGKCKGKQMSWYHRSAFCPFQVKIFWWKGKQAAECSILSLWRKTTLNSASIISIYPLSFSVEKWLMYEICPYCRSTLHRRVFSLIL